MFLFTKKSKDQKTFDKSLPEDLSIFISQNTKDPRADNCERSIQITEIKRMNKHNKRYIVFGDQGDREKKKFKNYIYFNFITANRPCFVFVSYKLTKTPEEKHREMMERIKDFKNRGMSEKIDYFALTPRT